ELADLGDGRPAGGACPVDGARRVPVRRRAGRLRGADPRDLRARGLALLRDGAALGRRHHRPARHAAGARDGYRSLAPRAYPRDEVRRLPDVIGARLAAILAVLILAACSTGPTPSPVAAVDATPPSFASAPGAVQQRTVLPGCGVDTAVRHGSGFSVPDTS